MPHSGLKSTGEKVGEYGEPVAEVKAKTKTKIRYPMLYGVKESAIKGLTAADVGKNKICTVEIHVKSVNEGDDGENRLDLEVRKIGPEYSHGMGKKKDNLESHPANNIKY